MGGGGAASTKALSIADPSLCSGCADVQSHGDKTFGLCRALFTAQACWLPAMLRDTKRLRRHEKTQKLGRKIGSSGAYYMIFGQAPQMRPS